MKKTIALILLLAMALGLAACGGGEDTAQIFHVGTSADYPPYEFINIDENGNEVFVGADIELAKILAEKLGMELKLTNMSFDGLLGSLAEGQFDCVIAGLTNDPEREVLFSDNYFARNQVCIINAASEGMINAIDDLNGLKIGGQTGTVQETLAKDYAGDSSVAVQNYNDMIMMLQGGQLDGIISDSDVAEGFVATNDDLMLAPFVIPYENDAVAIAFQLGNDELCDKVNAILAELKEDGTIDQLMADAKALQAEIATEE
ncbi:MAG: transporter substrate-binding domain-containing protein [Clostridia bacterium]|nr:transporter substrate-binding domain-containing protein [Clostridia bacterium]